MSGAAQPAVELPPGPDLAGLLRDVARAGVRLQLVDSALQVVAPPGSLSVQLRDRLTRAKPELLGWLSRTRERADSSTALPGICADREHLREPFLPSDLQMSFLVGGREELEFHVRPHQYLELDLDELDPERFERALAAALHRQRDNLVVVRDDMLLEAVPELTPVAVPVTDVRGEPDDVAQAAIERVRETMVRTELPLDVWPWFQMHVTRYGDGRGRLHVNNNNFFSDGPGTGRFLDSVLHLYARPDEPLPPLEISYRDCVLALAELERAPRGVAARRYWCERMADWPDAPRLPMAARSQRGQRSRLSRRELVLPADVWAAFTRRASRQGLTPTNAVYSAYAEILSFWSGSRHFLLNNMVTHRLPLHPQIGEVVGNFASLYPLEVDWRTDATFADRARRLQGQVMADLEQVTWSGVKVLQTLNQVRRTPGQVPCPFVVGSGLFMGQLDRPVFSHLETPQVLLDCQFWEQRDGSLWVVWDLIEEAFPDGLVDAMQEGFRALLTALAGGGEPWQAHAPDLLPAGQREHRQRLQAPPAPVPPGLLQDTLARPALTTPDKLCVVGADGGLTYRMVRERSARLAAALLAAGVPAGGRVAIVLPRSPEHVVAVLAVLRAGACWVPVDPGWPDDRLAFVLGDTAAAAVVALPPEHDRLGRLTAAPVLGVDARPLRTVPTPHAAVDPGAPAYVIYTSGSTGRPKGVVLDHRGPLNTVVDVNARFGVTGRDVLFAVSSPCFDLSVYDLFGSLAAGATLVLAAPGGDPRSWGEAVAEHGVTVWNSVPALAQLLVEDAEATGARYPSLRTVLLSGDWIPTSLPARLRAVAPNARVVSLGGATEVSIWSICHPVQDVPVDWASIPYGRAMTNQSWRVLDDLGRDCPDWVPGHLHIGGVGLALGYLGDPVRTDRAFVPDPRTGERLYRTGDVGRLLPTGEIELLGRSDSQVKVQGFRVEPGEIEQVLREHPQVREAAVAVRTAGTAKQLVAVAVPAGDGPAPAEKSLLAFLRERLPPYMVPARLSVVTGLPLTANGKVDRRALASLELPESGEVREHTPPRSPTEALLVDIWQDVLEVRPIGVHDDFFALGGQSFAALRVLGQVTRRRGRRVPLGALLEHRTVAALAGHLDRVEGKWSPLVRLREHGSGTPWFLVHPAGGQVLCYRGLAERLPAPSYGLQAPDHPQLQSVAELAELYTRAVVAARPAGPYRLAGWSSGAVLAHQVAHCLEQRGERVEHLVVLDAPAPLVPRDPADVELLAWFLEDLDRGPLAELLDPAQWRSLRGLPAEQLLPRALAVLRTRGVPVDEWGAADLGSTWSVFRTVVRACSRHRAPVLDADLTVVRAGSGRVGEFAGHPFAAAPDWGWSATTRGTVASATVAATHHTLLSDPHLPAVSQALSARSA